MRTYVEGRHFVLFMETVSARVVTLYIELLMSCFWFSENPCRQGRHFASFNGN